MSKTAKIIVIVLVAVAIIALAYWGYTKMYKKPAVASGATATSKEPLTAVEAPATATSSKAVVK